MPSEPVAVRRGLGFWLKLLAPTLVAILGLLAFKAAMPQLVGQGEVARWIKGWGDWAPLIFVLILAVRPVTLLPGQLLTAAGGLLFGAVWGFTYAMIGSLLSTALIFTLAQKLGPRLLQRMAGDKYPAMVKTAKRHDFLFAAVITLNPLFPTDVAIAAAAAAKARFWPTALGVLLGTLPGTFLTAQFGSALSNNKPLLTLLSGAGMVASLALGVFLGRRMLKEINAMPPPEPRKARGTSRSPLPTAV